MTFISMHIRKDGSAVATTGDVSRTASDPSEAFEAIMEVVRQRDQRIAHGLIQSYGAVYEAYDIVPRGDRSYKTGRYRLVLSGESVFARPDQKYWQPEGIFGVASVFRLDEDC